MALQLTGHLRFSLISFVSAGFIIQKEPRRCAKSPILLRKNTQPGDGQSG
jgi:hypothetical protein